jgi:hypothetical protein
MIPNHIMLPGGTGCLCRQTHRSYVSFVTLCLCGFASEQATDLARAPSEANRQTPLASLFRFEPADRRPEPGAQRFLKLLLCPEAV